MTHPKPYATVSVLSVILLTMILAGVTAEGLRAQVGGTPAQGGQPSGQPRPQNPLPRPADQQPATQPSGATTPQGAGINTPIARPFVFQSPQSQQQFEESTRDLALFEYKLNQSNQDLIKRAGAIRTLSGEKQSAAVVQLLQDMLRNNAELQRYLIQSRQVWTGLDPVPATAAEPQTGQP